MPELITGDMELLDSRPQSSVLENVQKGFRTLFPRSVPQKTAYNIAKFNRLTLDGPKSNNSKPDYSYLSVNITEHAIIAKIIDENGNLMDSFSIDHNGFATEIQRSSDIKPHDLQK